MLLKAGCITRMNRLRAAMAAHSIDVVLFSQPHHVYWVSGYRPHWLQQAAVAVTADGRSMLVAAAPGPRDVAVDEVRPYPAAFRGTQRSEQPALVAAAVLDWLTARRPARVGLDAGAACVNLAMEFGSNASDVSPMMHQLRRKKEDDELALMRKAIDCTAAMYKVARGIIAPGKTELDLFCQMHHAAVLTAGEPLSDLLGNDFACGVPGGRARNNRAAKAGQLYILDLGPAYRGYFADNARTFCVDRKPTDFQLKAAAALEAVFPLVEAAARPGVRCAELYELIDRHLQEQLGVGLSHHLGHGVGLEPHEFPHLNPDWDDVLVEGEIFTAEPGVYSSSLNGGIRIENQYLVTATGVGNLTNFSMSLV